MSTRDDDAVKLLLEEWGLNGPVAPFMCPRCHKTPELVVERDYSDLVTMYYECRRWFGLRRCFIGPKVYEDHHWQDYGQRGAAVLWNRAAMRMVAP